MKELELLQEVIRDLEYLEERETEVCDKQGYFSHYMTHMGYFDKDDRDGMVKKLKMIQEYLKEKDA